MLQVYVERPMLITRVFERHQTSKVEREALKDNFRSERPSTSRTEVNIMGKVGEVWRSLVDCSNDCKSAGHEKEQCLEDYYYGHVCKVKGLGVLSILQFLAERNIAVLEQQPHSPDRAPRDFFLSSKLKGMIKIICFESLGVIKMIVKTDLRGILDKYFQ